MIYILCIIYRYNQEPIRKSVIIIIFRGFALNQYWDKAVLKTSSSLVIQDSISNSV
jgi:hypothetical protein